jgi:hypothetical protein
MGGLWQEGVQEADGDGQTTLWGDHVTDEEYPGSSR